ncbi:MAG: antitoxin family protein [bacterium]
MKKEIVAVYENGLLRPLTPLDLKENQKVNLKITKMKSVVLATNDSDFDHIPNLAVWKPGL